MVPGSSKHLKTLKKIQFPLLEVTMLRKGKKGQGNTHLLITYFWVGQTFTVEGQIVNILGIVGRASSFGLKSAVLA